MSQTKEISPLTPPEEIWIKIDMPDTEANHFRHDLVTNLVSKGVAFVNFTVFTNEKHNALRIVFKTSSKNSMGNLQKAMGTTMMQWYDVQHILYEDAKTKTISSIPHEDTLEGILFIQGITYKSEEK